ncbi:hypothetical protein PV08_06983 [Exophiala spinifera]|uniref:Apple domain-containing protein n=1 Tax=Exophiala spinifera TaxID=91928 RepID=A0A0D1ZMZ2_9EURO|nr:uncharacterized protein PV08_06983 [Exophiala spinifera]KIW14202.1 hypothetical protein PV08_06983 [Exophiala spinifera]
MSGTYSSSGLSDKYAVTGEAAQHVYPEVATHNPPGIPKSALPQAIISEPQHDQYQYQHQNGYVPPEAVAEPSPPLGKRNPWGLSPLTFGLLVATITALVVGGAVGGGVAGAMSGQDSDSNSESNAALQRVSVPTATITITASADGGTGSVTGTSSTSTPSPSSLQNYVVAEPYFVGSLEYPDCNTDTQVITTSKYSRLFTLYCGIDMGSSTPDDTNPDLTVADYVALFAYTVTDCLYACSNMVYFADRWGQDSQHSCKGVTWNGAMAASNTSDFANCWLKNGTHTQEVRQCNTCVSAALST